MPDDRLTLTDWLSAQARLAQGRTSDPSQDKLYAADTPAWWWPQQAYRERQTPGLIPRPDDVEALPLGSLSDPVSQAAFLMAPGVLRAGKAGADALAQPGYARSFGQGGRLTMLGGQRGNLGPVPRSEYGEALPRSVVRGEDGKLTKLYHGTNRVYPDFDMSKAGSGAGGDLYGPGIYMTESPPVAQGYATTLWSDEAKAAMRSLDNVKGMEAYHAEQAAQARTLDTAMYHLEQIEQIKPLIQSETRRVQGHMEQTPWMFQDPAHIRPVYADLKRPFDMAAPVTQTQIDELRAVMGPDWGHASPNWGDVGVVRPGMSGEEVWQMLGAKADANTALQKAGYDGITHIGGGNTGTAPHRVYIAFSPENVYPAPNVEALP